MNVTDGQTGRHLTTANLRYA